MLGHLLQVVAVFDADQVARPNFFTRTLPWLQDGRESVVLTPQYFHNFDVNTDIFSHRQAAYWNMILPGQVSRAKPLCGVVHATNTCAGMSVKHVI
jgi:cellulose synthase/poly-beta-1,6-N-acetylglucosamine synthase-like glycosyltransferase